MIASAPVFRFDSARHVYTLDGQQIPSVTQLLDAAQLVKGKKYFTESSRQRGSEVHALAADYDLGVDLGGILEKSGVRAYVLGYIGAAMALKPRWEAVEEPEVHPVFRFAGTPDRVGTVFGRPTVAEIKTGARSDEHAVQVALQAVLISHRLRIDPDDIQRIVIYTKKTGKYETDQWKAKADRVDEEKHTHRLDLERAFKVLKEHAC